MERFNLVSWCTNLKKFSIRENLLDGVKKWNLLPIEIFGNFLYLLWTLPEFIYIQSFQLTNMSIRLRNGWQRRWWNGYRVVEGRDDDVACRMIGARSEIMATLLSTFLSDLSICTIVHWWTYGGTDWDKLELDLSQVSLTTCSNSPHLTVWLSAQTYCSKFLID